MAITMNKVLRHEYLWNRNTHRSYMRNIRPVTFTLNLKILKPEKYGGIYAKTNLFEPSPHNGRNHRKH